MKIVAWDTETALIEQGKAAPAITCLSYMMSGDDSGSIVHWKDAKSLWLSWVEADYSFVGHHIAFDHAVLAAEWPELLPTIFELYDEGRIHDTMLRQKLLDLAEGKLRGFRTSGGAWVKLEYSLEAVARRLCKMQLDKDEWRLRYGEFRNVPLSAWPEGAIQYPIKDAEATMRSFEAQELRNKERGGGKFLVDEGNQVRKAWWIHLMTSWGIRTNPKRVDSLIEKTNGAYSELEAVLKEEKLIRSDGTRDMKAVQSRMEKVMGGRYKCRLTDTGQISTDNDACMSSDDPILQAYAELAQFKAVVSKDVPMLQMGRWLPIHSRFDTLLETGRTSSSKPNIQNIRRMAGIRECFVPRPGKVFACADYDGLELRTLAQVCYSLFGQSDLRDALNEGRDPHLEVAAYLLRIPYEEAQVRRKKKDKEVDRARQMGKVCNFGCPGGLGAQTLVVYAKANFGLVLTEQEAKDLKYNVWQERWPEMQKYMNFISSSFNADDSCPPIEQLFSGRYRGGCRYTQACNTLFQGLGADATGAAGFLISQACYVDTQSVLYGSRIVNYIHDEFILEVPEEQGHDCAMELARLMEEGARPWLPDVPPKVSEPLLARCWSKDARQVWGEDGRLLPWTSDYY